MTEGTFVVQAYKHIGSGARFRYFASTSDVPEGWIVSDPFYDIASIMEANGLSREQALELMNR